MGEAISAYLRYRALLLPFRRCALDSAWSTFQGNGATPYGYTPMCDDIPGFVNRSLAFLKTIE